MIAADGFGAHTASAAEQQRRLVLEAQRMTIGRGPEADAGATDHLGFSRRPQASANGSRSARFVISKTRWTP